MLSATMELEQVHMPGQVIPSIRVLSAPSIPTQPSGAAGQRQVMVIKFVSAITLMLLDCPLFAAPVPLLQPDFFRQQVTL